MLSREEAITFADSVLGIADPMTKLAESKLDFLNLLIAKVQGTIPYQCVSLLSVKFEDRHKPTWDEVKTAMFQKAGGLCYTFNIFMFQLLKAFEYDAYLNHCTATIASIYQNSHVLVIVKNVLKANDSYLCDAAIGYPSFEAVSLDFDSESPLLHNSFLEYKYVKHEGKVLRMHGEGDVRSETKASSDLFLGKFRRFYELELNPTSCMSAFDECCENIYTNPDATPFHKSMRALKYEKGRATIIVNRRLMVENDEHKFDVTVLDTNTDICKAYRTHFPEIPQAQLMIALDNWMKTKKEMKAS